MITNIHHINYSEQYLASRGLSPESCAFFDIETTGFKACSSHLYLIGAAFRTPSGDAQVQCNPQTPHRAVQTDIGAGLTPSVSDWTIIQWLAERPQEETALLRAFSDFMTDFDTVIHFNGKRFDIPYLEEKYEQYQIASPFTEKASVDLYQDFRPLKAFLNLERMNQKSLEVFLGLNRDDQYDGGKLIPVYREYCKTGSEDLLRLLLLHNREDVSGMSTLTSLYGYLNVCQHPVGAPYISFSDDTAFLTELLTAKDGTMELLFTFELKTPVPVPVSKMLDYGYLTLKKSTGKLLIHVLNDTLYYYFPNYKDYYYLTQEDQAVHKSVAAYVDKQYRKQAKADTCYIRQSGCFLPQTEELFTPALRRCYTDKLRWFALDDKFLQDKEKLAAYLTSLLAIL